MTLTKKQQEECDRMFKEWFNGYKFNKMGGSFAFQLTSFRACYSIMIQRIEEKDKEIEALQKVIACLRNYEDPESKGN